jgi:hypothetical protein
VPVADIAGGKEYLRSIFQGDQVFVVNQLEYGSDFTVVTSAFDDDGITDGIFLFQAHAVEPAIRIPSPEGRGIWAIFLRPGSTWSDIVVFPKLIRILNMSAWSDR